MNAWGAQLADEFFFALNECHDDDECRVVIVTGEGRAFCAGADAQGRFDPNSETTEEKKRRLLREDAKKSWEITRFHDISLKMRQPVVCAINGGCVGIGLSMALACDLRFASADAKVGVIFPQRGLIAEDGMGYYLPRLMGTGDALMMLLTGEVRKASEWPQGMFQNIFPTQDALKEGTIAFAKALAINSSPSSMAVIKKQVFTLPHMSLLDSQIVNDQVQAATTDPTPGVNPDHEEGL